MTSIESLVSRLVPDFCKNRKISLIGIKTTNPVFLVFGDSNPHPELVLRMSKADHICRTHSLLEELHDTVGDLVPQPLIVTKIDEQYITIQKGMDGDPWFQIAGKYSDAKQWNKLRIRSIETLQMLHSAIGSKTKWKITCRPGDLLRDSYSTCLESGTSLTPKTRDLTEALCTRLDDLGEIQTLPQHGDFCLNNLIISKTKIGIIDFEDFGITTMPLHDHFSLALSFHQLAPREIVTTLQEEIHFFTSNVVNNLGYDEEIVAGLFLNHLLVRLGAWSQMKNRKEFRRGLISILDDFTVENKARFVR